MHYLKCPSLIRLPGPLLRKRYPSPRILSIDLQYECWCMYRAIVHTNFHELGNIVKKLRFIVRLELFPFSKSSQHHWAHIHSCHILHLRSATHQKRSQRWGNINWVQYISDSSMEKYIVSLRIVLRNYALWTQNRGNVLDMVLKALYCTFQNQNVRQFNCLDSFLVWYFPWKVTFLIDLIVPLL